jgi:hypothetical protein
VCPTVPHPLVSSTLLPPGSIPDLRPFGKHGMALIELFISIDTLIGAEVNSSLGPSLVRESGSWFC